MRHLYLCWQNDNTILGVATSKKKAEEMCAFRGDSYLRIEANKATRKYVETTEMCHYNVNGEFLTYKECIRRGIRFIEKDVRSRIGGEED